MSEKDPKCGLCLDTGYVLVSFGVGDTHKRVCSCGQALQLLFSTFEDMKAYLKSTGLELRISPEAVNDGWFVALHGLGEYNVGVAQDEDLVLALRKAIQTAMRRIALNAEKELRAKGPRWQCGECGEFNAGNDLSVECRKCGERGDVRENNPCPHCGSTNTSLRRGHGRCLDCKEGWTCAF